MILLLGIYTVFTVSAELVAVVELAREPTAHPRYFSKVVQGDIGEITETGILQELRLGREIKSRYIEVIMSGFSEKSAIFVKNSPCSMKAMSIQLKEIYGEGAEKWIKSKDESVDFMLSPEKSCQRINYLLKKNIERFEKHDQFLEILQRRQELEKVIGNVTVRGIYELGDYFISLEEQGHIPLLDLENSTVALVKNIYHRYHDWLLYGDIEQGKLALTEIINKIAEFIKITFTSKHAQRFLPFMMDEPLFLALLHVLGLDYSPKPPGSAVFIELHKVMNKNTVRFSFNGRYIESVVCGIECSVQEINDFLLSRTVKVNLNNACSFIGETSKDFNFKYIIVIAILLIMIIIMKYWEKIKEFINKLKRD